MSAMEPPSPDDPAAVDAAAGVAHQIYGTVMPVLHVDLQPGQAGGKQARLHHPQPQIGNALRHCRVMLRIARQQSHPAPRPHAGMACTRRRRAGKDHQ